MKRVWILLLAAVCTAALAACNERDLPGEVTEDIPPAAALEVVTTAAYSRGEVSMTLSLPEGWAWEAVEDGGMGTATEGLRFYKTGDAAVDWMLLCWTEGYGICGTGVDSRKLTLSGGQTVYQHTETMTDVTWVNIAFENSGGSYVAMPAGGGTMDPEVWESCREEVLAILGTAELPEA